MTPDQVEKVVDLVRTQQRMAEVLKRVISEDESIGSALNLPIKLEMEIRAVLKDAGVE